MIFNDFRNKKHPNKKNNLLKYDEIKKYYIFVALI